MPPKVAKEKKKGDKKKDKGEAQQPPTRDPSKEEKLWSIRFEISEKARKEHRANAATLLIENESLQSKMQQIERDSIEVIQHLKKEINSAQKECQIVSDQLKEFKKQAKRDREALVDDFSQQIGGLEDKLLDKDERISTLTSELTVLKEFKNGKAQLEREFEQIKEAAEQAQQAHEERVKRLEASFFEEKIRLQKEYDKQISKLAEKAQAEAMENLDVTTRRTYKENARLTEGLALHIKESTDLRKQLEVVTSENRRFRDLQSDNDAMMKDSVTRYKQQEKHIEFLKAKVDTLETSLSHVVREFDLERSILNRKADHEQLAIREELQGLHATLEAKSAETKRIKKLARTILEQRSEVETFFLEALSEVKGEIASARSQYIKEAQSAFTRTLADAQASSSELPPVRTFRESKNSSNPVHRDFEGAEGMPDLDKVDFKGTTWEQKEKVLIGLLGRINGARPSPSGPSPFNPSPASTFVASHPTLKPDAHRPALPAPPKQPRDQTPKPASRSVFITEDESSTIVAVGDKMKIPPIKSAT